MILDYDEEIRKFKPSLEVDDIEDAVYQEDLTDMTDRRQPETDQSKQERSR